LRTTTRTTLFGRAAIPGSPTKARARTTVWPPSRADNRVRASTAASTLKASCVQVRSALSWLFTCFSPPCQDGLGRVPLVRARRHDHRRPRDHRRQVVHPAKRAARALSRAPCLLVAEALASTTDSECPSHSDFDSQIIDLSYGQNGGGVRNGPPPDRPLPFRPDIRTSYNSRIRSPFDQSQLPNFTKRRGDFFSSTSPPSIFSSDRDFRTTRTRQGQPTRLHTSTVGKDARGKDARICQNL